LIFSYDFQTPISLTKFTQLFFPVFLYLSKKIMKKEAIRNLKGLKKARCSSIFVGIFGRQSIIGLVKSRLG